MADYRRKKQYTPMEVAKILKISMGRFTNMVADGSLPKGRIGDDGKRYYTQRDLDFMLREWKTQTTGRFLMYTLPLLVVLGFLLVLTIVEINEKIEESRVVPTATPPFGYGAPPPQYYGPGTPWPSATPSETPTPIYDALENYRNEMRQKSMDRELQRKVRRRPDRPKLFTAE
ncbi:MAG TPA: helix-turn-helix domain-containing protein [bacterium]|nr:helix-turn-helix domain-containing protein [bacterium]